MNHFLFILPLMVMVLLACEGEVIDPVKASKSIKLTAEIEGVRTRASGSTWEKNDGIGVYMKKAGEPLNAALLEKNIHYFYNDSGYFKSKNVEQTIYFPFNGSNVDFIGYYPYRADISGFTVPVDLSMQSNQATIDLMYSNNMTTRNMTNPNVNMTFSHRLSKMTLQITHYRNISLGNLSVFITRVSTEASFNLENGNLTILPGTKDIAMRVNVDGTAAEAILLPGTDLSGSELWFVIGNNEQIYRSPLIGILPADTLGLSVLHSLDITLFTDEKAAVLETSNITPWITPPSVSVIADRTESLPPPVKGTKSDPYTVFQAIEAQGKTDVWVKGYIVGAFDGTINKFVTDTTGQVKTNIALADNLSEMDISKMLPVNFTTASIKSGLNIVDNPLNINRFVLVKGNLAAYYSVPALREVSEYQFID
ncbi:MAG: fimbrillin family protein [Porphyromonadaceae bacterium]|nr:fimbrillin family protein [Porphyromonadaceae bacterium]